MKGVPVCFCIIDKEVTNILVEWFTWLKNNFTLNVNRIMIDCSQTEITAIRSAFPSVNISLCHWHIKRAWEMHIKKEIKISNATHETKAMQEQARVFLNSMMHATDEGVFYSIYESFKLKFKDFMGFVAYFDKQWLERCDIWCKAWRRDATFHTNNLIESYHNKLKTIYLGRSRNLRVDRLVYMLSQIVILDYRQEALQTLIGIRPVALNAREKKRKSTADSIDIQEASLMITTVSDNTFTCKSFNPDSDNIYEIKIENNYVHSCSCPDSVGICKHMFLVSRVMVIPFSFRKKINIAQKNSNKGKEKETDNSARLSALLEDAQRFTNMLNKEVNRFSAEENRSLIALDEVEDGIQSLKNTLSILEKIGKTSQTRPSRQSCGMGYRVVRRWCKSPHLF